jgi:predicted alpha/beta superfamily hydrolase
MKWRVYFFWVAKSVGEAMKAMTASVGWAAAMFVLIAVGRAQDSLTPPAPVKLTIHSSVLNEDRTVWVRMPRSYADGKLKYPVLYVTDGDDHINEIGNTNDFLASNGRMPELIVVGIGNTDRTRDLTPTHVEKLETFPISTQTSGGGGKFLEFIQSELRAEVEKRYRTEPYRIFAGHSFGGLLAIHAAFTRPESFNAFIAVSPSLWWDDQAEVKRAEKFLAGRKSPLKMTLIMTGAGEGPMMRSGYEKLRQVLLTSNPPPDLEWDSTLFEDEDHNSTVLRAHYFALKRIFADFPVQRDPHSFLVMGGLSGLEDHYGELSKRYGYTLAVPENAINMLGYGYLYAKPPRFAQAIAAFKRNVELYPQSANGYDSLGEGYEKAGDGPNAKASYEKAIALAKEQKDSHLPEYEKHLGALAEKATPGEKK